ncbi:unnamed protein product, partial [Dibothriocephalus latus]
MPSNAPVYVLSTKADESSTSARCEPKPLMVNSNNLSAQWSRILLRFPEYYSASWLPITTDVPNLPSFIRLYGRACWYSWANVLWTRSKSTCPVHRTATTPPSAVEHSTTSFDDIQHPTAVVDCSCKRQSATSVQGGCKFATKDQRQLEDNFEERVLKRSSRALAACNYTWTPLKRPEITDTEPDARVNSFSKHSRKRAASRRNTEKINRVASNSASQSLHVEDTSECVEKSPKNPDSVDSPDIEALSPDDLMELITNNVNESSSRSLGPSLLPDAAERGLRQQMEVAHKLANPLRLHPDIWHNEEGEHNNGPACSCKPKYRIGPLHKQYEGEEAISLCDPESNNHDRLFHYRVMVNPTTNFFNLKPTTIHHAGHAYLFDGFSIFLHSPLEQLPPCQLLRFNLLYDFVAVEEEFPQNFTVRSLDMLTDYIFRDLLELLDLNWRPAGVTTGCPVVHLLPRFVRIVQTTTAGPTAELLSVNVILEHWMRQTELPVIDALELAAIQKMSDA